MFVLEVRIKGDWKIEVMSNPSLRSLINDFPYIYLNLITVIIVSNLMTGSRSKSNH